MQNAAFSAAGIDAVYVPFPVQEAELANAVTGLRALSILGCNITVPHKEKIAEYLDYLSPEAQAIGAVNTIVRNGDTLEGYNTDAGGFITSLAQDLGFTPYANRVVVLGAGGAARACVYALARAETTAICVANRNPKRAESICRDFSPLFSATSITSCGLNDKSFTTACMEADLIVNTTSIGLIDKAADPLPWGNINSKTLFYDVVYKAGSTPMVTSAREHGLHAVDGLGMLIGQGEQAFRIWTGIEPGDAMRRSLANEI
jgi:shikimate dehydrogenase